MNEANKFLKDKQQGNVNDPMIYLDFNGKEVK